MLPIERIADAYEVVDTGHKRGSVIVTPSRPTGGGIVKAIVQDGYGGPEVLRVAEVPEPAPGRRDVAIRVHAAGVHAGDVRIMRGDPLMLRAAFGRTRPRRPVIGRDIVGTVVAVGQRRRGLSVGDRVFAESDQGGFAEVVVVDAPHVRRAPANLDDEHAAVIPVSGTTALQGSAWPGPRGQTVLVIGASGGVGTFAVQLAAGLGAEVTGVASAAKAEHVRAAGAAHVIDYRAVDVTAQGERYDVIFDLVGDRPLGALRRILAPRGTLVLSSGGGRAVLGPLGRIIRASVLDLFTRGSGCARSRRGATATTSTSSGASPSRRAPTGRRPRAPDRPRGRGARAARVRCGARQARAPRAREARDRGRRRSGDEHRAVGERGDEHPRREADRERTPPGVQQRGHAHRGAEREQRHREQRRLHDVGRGEHRLGHRDERAQEHRGEEPRDEQRHDRGPRAGGIRRPRCARPRPRSRPSARAAARA